MEDLRFEEELTNPGRRRKAGVTMSSESYIRPTEGTRVTGRNQLTTPHATTSARKAMMVVTRRMKLPRQHVSMGALPSPAQANSPKLQMGRQRSSDSPSASIGMASVPNAAGYRPNRPEQAEHVNQRTRVMVWAMRIRPSCLLGLAQLTAGFTAKEAMVLSNKKYFIY